MLSLQMIKSFRCLGGCSVSALRFSTMICLVEKFRKVFLYIPSKFHVGSFKIRFRILQFVNGSYWRFSFFFELVNLTVTTNLST